MHHLHLNIPNSRRLRWLEGALFAVFVLGWLWLGWFGSALICNDTDLLSQVFFASLFTVQNPIMSQFYNPFYIDLGLAACSDSSMFLVSCCGAALIVGGMRTPISSPTDSLQASL